MNVFQLRLNFEKNHHNKQFFLEKHISMDNLVVLTSVVNYIRKIKPFSITRRHDYCHSFAQIFPYATICQYFKNIISIKL